MRIILSCVMILLLLFTLVAVPITSAQAFAGVAVVGTAVMTLALLAEIYMICAGASGMDGAIRNQARASGTQPLDYMGQLLNRWSSNTGRSLTAVANLFQAGFNYLSDGTFQLDSGCTEAVADFQMWAWSADGADLVDYAPVNAPDYMTDGTFDVALVTCNNLVDISGTSYFYPNAGFRPSNTASWNLMTVGSTMQDAQYYVYGYVQRNNSGIVQGYKIYAAPANVYSCTALMLYYGGSSTSVAQVGYTLTDSTFTQIISASASSSGEYDGIPVNDTVRTSFNVSDFSGDPVPIGDPETFYGPSQQGVGSEISASNVSVSAEAAARLHVENYIRARAAAYAGTGTVDVPVTDVGSGEDETLPLSVPLDTPVTVTGITDVGIAQSGSAAVSDAVSTDFAGTDDYTMDLTQFFPFCIPFDLAYLYEKLRADPESLVIHWRFVIPYLDVDIPLDVDLSIFDDLMEYVRTVELIAFCVGLMLATKGLIQGGD